MIVGCHWAFNICQGKSRFQSHRSHRNAAPEGSHTLRVKEKKTATHAKIHIDGNIETIWCRSRRTTQRPFSLGDTIDTQLRPNRIASKLTRLALTWKQTLRDTLRIIATSAGANKNSGDTIWPHKPNRRKRCFCFRQTKWLPKQRQHKSMGA